jgi:hypothetical protein
MAEEMNVPQQNVAPQVNIDYDKIASLVEGKQKVAEDQVLKGYFKQQGLSEDEMKQAITTFKEEKAKRTPNIDALNQQITDANKRALNAEIKLQAMTMAGELGVPASKMPYLLKMADLSKVAKDGNINTEQLKESLTGVLKDVPELKSTPEQTAGFKVGADGGQKANTSNEELARIFGVKMK